MISLSVILTSRLEIHIRRSARRQLPRDGPDPDEIFNDASDDIGPAAFALTSHITVGDNCSTISYADTVAASDSDSPSLPEFNTSVAGQSITHATRRGSLFRADTIDLEQMAGACQSVGCADATHCGS